MDNQMKPLITVITVSFNAVKTIEQTINSVLNQSYFNIEYIIIDGGSTDGTVEIIKKYADRLAYWVTEPDKGIYDAMNKGISKASGSIIGIVNSDDWYENVLNEVAASYLKNGDDCIYHGDVRLYFTHKSDYIYKPTLDLSRFYKGTIINHPTVFVPKKVYASLGTFDVRYKIAADYDFLIRCYQNSKKFIYLDMTISNMRCEGVSNQQARKGYAEAKSIALRHGFPTHKVYYYYCQKCILNAMADIKKFIFVYK